MASADYDQEERSAMDELRKRMNGLMEEELYSDDNVFYRFLKARDFNIDNAELMLKEHVEWRKKYDVKNVLNYKHPEVLWKYLPFNRLGHDKEGCVVHYVPAGNIDWIGLFTSAKIDDVAKRLIHFTEEDCIYLKEYSKKTGKTVYKIIYILNMENLSFAQATHKKVVFNSIFLLNLYQNNYPERMTSIKFINVSTYFYLLYAVLKKLLPGSIINKFKLYSDDSWKEDFLQSIDAEILPAFLGGKKTDPDGNPLCLTFINHGEPVPEKYHIHRSKRSLAHLAGVERLTLARAAFREVLVEVEEPDSFVEWEFETRSRDVGFGLFYDAGDGSKSAIIPIQRINTDEFAESGICKCDSAGKYIVVFDNTFSLLRKKDIFYKIKVIKPNEEISDVK